MADQQPIRLKIISDGGDNTKIIDAETGRPLQMVQEVYWHIAGDSAVATAWLKLVGVPVEVEGMVVPGDRPPWAIGETWRPFTPPT